MLSHSRTSGSSSTCPRLIPLMVSSAEPVRPRFACRESGRGTGRGDLGQGYPAVLGGGEFHCLADGLDGGAVGEARLPGRVRPASQQVGHLVDETGAVADALADRPPAAGPVPATGRSVMNVCDCALTSLISPTIQRARSIRWLPRSAIVVPPMARSNRQSQGVAGSVNSSDSQLARHSRTSPTTPSATIWRMSATAGSFR